jgi:hypothetical protein
MSETQSQSTIGRCPVCKQAQSTTNQICDICESRLPWAEQPISSMPIPPTMRAPVPAAAPRPAPHINANAPSSAGASATRIKLAGVALLVVIGLVVVGNDLKREQAPANAQNIAVAPASPVLSSPVAPPVTSSECGTLTPAECEWQMGFNKAVAPIDMTQEEREPYPIYFDRMSRQAFQVKVNLYALPPAPPRYQEIYTLMMRALAEWDSANQTAKKAEQTRSEPLVREAVAGFRAAADTFTQVSEKFRAIGATPPPGL